MRHRLSAGPWARAVAVGIGVALAAGLGGVGAAEAPERWEAAEPNEAPGRSTGVGRLDVPLVVRGSTARLEAVDGVATGDPDPVDLTAGARGLLVARLVCPPGADLDLALLDGDGRRVATSRSDNLDPAVGTTEVLRHEVEQGERWTVEVAGFAGRPGPWSLALAIRARAARRTVAPQAARATQVAPMASPRAFHAALALAEGDAWVGGGTRSTAGPLQALLGALASTERYEALGDAWVAGPDLSRPRWLATATLLPTGEVLVAGGDLRGTADLLSPERAGRVVAGGLALASGMRLAHTATLLADGRVLLAGGSAARLGDGVQERPLDTTEVFDPKTRAFTPGPRLTHARTSHATVRLADGRILVIGGVGRGDSDLLDRGARTVRPGPRLSGPRDDHTATLLAGGSVLVVGGQEPGGTSLATAEILRGDAAAAERFEVLPTRLGQARSDHVAIGLPDGTVLLLGGEQDPGGGGPDRRLGSVERFDPAQGAFAPLARLLVPRDDHRAVLLADGRVLVTGGGDERRRALAAAETWGP